MKHKLTPQKGVLVAGLLAGMYANACYYQVTQTCTAAGSSVDLVGFPDGAATLTATSDWTALSATTVVGGTAYGGTALPHYCAGPAKFINLINSHTETITWWQFNVVSGFSHGSQYTDVDYTTCNGG